jgi:FAD/FMN-containing dehydrogenase
MRIPTTGGDAVLDTPELTAEQEHVLMALVELHERVRGELIFPDSASYDEARRLFNGALDRRPALIVRPADAQDVAAALAYARAAGLPLAVRSGGHNNAGLASVDGGVVIDLRSMAAIAVDAGRRVARVGMGASNGEVVAALAAHGLATTTGTCASVGMGGSTLGGGIGWLMGRYGMTIDNVLAFEVVTADERVLRASADEHPDLFWALRGGGGNFGVVTAAEYRVHPVGAVFAGMAIFPMAMAEAVLKAYAAVGEEGPAELIAFAMLATVPEIGPAVIVQGCYAGDDPAAGEAAMAPVRALGPLVDLFRVMPYADYYMLATPPVPYGAPVAEGAYTLRRLTPAAIDGLIATAAAMPTPFSSIVLHQFRGAAAAAAPDATAFALREPHYAVANVGMWAEGDGEQARAWVAAAGEAMAPLTSPGLYINFLGKGSEADIRASYRANYARLAAVKAAYDPENRFRSNQNIAPQG